jgi:D-beta-D-heptose 7-phosphate kinase/D-beta-D-heptose 1-phosphate adenosyltransferase
MFRLDHESSAPLSPGIRDAVLQHIREAIGSVDVICLEDYGKGVCDEALIAGLVEAATAAGVEVLVDPAGLSDFGRYRGCTAITPNRTEAERATASLPIEACPEIRGRHLQDVTGATAVIMTLDRHGALLLESGCEPCPVPTVPRDVYDVTGAGDMVLAAIAAGRAHGLSWQHSVQLANAAAGLEVEVFGAQAVPLARIRQEVLRTVSRVAGKVRDRDELVVELEGARAAGQRIVLTNGCFDVIHAGHVAYLRDARAQGDLLVVGVNSDAQIAAMKGEGRPVFPLAERLDILAELQCIDLLCVFEEPTAHDLIEAVRPDVYVKGGDYAPEAIAEHDLVRSLGIELKVLVHRPGLSSTDTIERLGED